MPAIPSQEPAGRRQQEAIATPQRRATIPAQHTQPMAQDENLDLTRNVVMLATPGEQTQQATDGEVDKREQHRALEEEMDRELAILLDEATQANVSRVCEPLTVTPCRPPRGRERALRFRYPGRRLCARDPPAPDDVGCSP